MANPAATNSYTKGIAAFAFRRHSFKRMANAKSGRHHQIAPVNAPKPMAAGS
jgi:hypothetical protein